MKEILAIFHFTGESIDEGLITHSEDVYLDTLKAMRSEGISCVTAVGIDTKGLSDIIASLITNKLDKGSENRSIMIKFSRL